MKIIRIEDCLLNSYNIAVISRKFHLLLSTAVAISIFSNPISGFAQNLSPTPKSSNTQVLNPPDSNVTVVLGEVVEHESVDEVARTALEEYPTATVLVREPDPSAAPIKITYNAKIIPQPANDLNTALIYASFGAENSVILVSPLLPDGLTWVQTASLLAFNTAYLKKISLTLGLWSRWIQKIENPIANRLTSARISKSKAHRIGQFIAHGVLLYAIYAMMQALSNVPDLHAGFFSVAAQLNILRKTGIGFASGFGWTLLARKWDALKDTERPISRQAYTTFNSVRSLALSPFRLFLFAMPNSVSVTEFILRTSPYVISGTTGTIAYIWGDKIVARYPQVATALERFEKVTERLNEKLAQGRNRFANKLRQVRACAKILSRAIPFQRTEEAE